MTTEQATTTIRFRIEERTPAHTTFRVFVGPAGPTGQGGNAGLLTFRNEEYDALAPALLAAPELLEALRACVEASENEWLYQTGQFSRRESPPRDYPNQGSIHGSLYDAKVKAHEAIEKAEAPA